jgi:hypothetical protein
MTGGVYCLSATMLHRSYTMVRGPWSEAYEHEYQRLTAWVHHLNQLPKDAKPTDTDGSALTAKEVQDRLVNLEQMRFARLCFFLQLRRPDAVIGHSILIYRLTDLEVGVAEGASLPVLLQAASLQDQR